jgi:hypothetical protein
MHPRLRFLARHRIATAVFLLVLLALAGAVILGRAWSLYWFGCDVLKKPLTLSANMEAHESVLSFK